MLLRGNLPSAILTVTNFTYTGTGSNMGLRGDRSTTDRLSHSTALKAKLILNNI